MWATLYSCGTLLTMVVASHGVGRQIVRRWDLPEMPQLALAAWSLLLGLIAHAGLFSLAAFAGILSVGFVGGVTVVTSFWGLGELACAYLYFRAPHRVRVAELDDLMAAPLPPPLPRWLAWSVGAVAVACCVCALVAALSPPVSNYVLSSSLNLPKQLVLAGSRPAVEVIGELNSPQFLGMLYAWGYGLDGPVSANLINWLFGLLLLAGTALCAKPLLGSQYAWLAGVVPLVSPGLRYQMTIPAVDLPTAACCAFALAAWWKGIVEQTSRRWLWVAGMCWAAAMGTSVTAAAALIGALLMWCYEVSRGSEQRLAEFARSAGFAAIVACVLAAPWWIATVANGGSLLATAAQPADWLQLGPWWLAILPGLLVCRKLRGMHLVGGLVVCIAATSWWITPRGHVFLLLLPPLSLLATWVLMELHRCPRAARWGLVALLLPVGLADSWRSLTAGASALPVAIGWRSHANYLQDRVPTFRAAQVANSVVRSECLVASNDARLLYFDCRTRLVDEGEQPNLQQLRAEGVQYLLWRSAAHAPAPLLSTESNLIALTSYTANPPGQPPCRYDLFMLSR